MAEPVTDPAQPTETPDSARTVPPNTGQPPLVDGSVALTSTDAPASVGEGPEARSDAAPSEPPAPPSTETPATPTEAKPTDVPEAKPSLLSEAAAAEPPKEEPKEGEAAPEVEVPHYEPFTLPEGFHVSEERMAPFVQFFGENKLSQEQAQSFLNIGLAELQRAVAEERASWQTQFDGTREGWREEFEKDPELGGNRRQTTINSVVGLIRHFASNADHLKKTLQVLDFTGAGDHPDVIRLFANAAKGLAQQYREGAPIRAEMPAPQEQSRYRRRYANSANGSAKQ